MDARDAFLFDLNGFIVLRGVLTETEVAEMNGAIDRRLSAAVPRDSVPLKNTADATPFRASGPRRDLGGVLTWEDTDAFRRLLAHPVLSAHVRALCGSGYRLDHQPLVIVQERGSEGFSLHGGPVSGDGHLNPALQYRCHNERPWTSLLAMSVCLCDTNRGDGGFVVVKGSHKLNFPVPKDFAHQGDQEGEENVYHPKTKKGDVVLFSEATVHGAVPWQSEAQRRLAIYRFAPPGCAYGRSYVDGFSAFGVDVSALCTPEQRAVLEPPYAARLERPVVVGNQEGTGVEVTKNARAEEKREHDRKVFGCEYY